MDQQTTFVIGAVMMLANGGILGLVHANIMPQLQESAVTWRRGTLLCACACIMFAITGLAPAGLVVPLSNSLLLLGITAYWHALRQFDERPLQPWMLLPCVVGIAGASWFVLVDPAFKIRLAFVSLAMSSIFLGAASTVLAPPTPDRAISRRVLAILFIGIAAFVLVRLIMLLGSAIPPDANLFNPAMLINAITPILIGVLPVVGTTAFLLMCAERLKRRWEEAASIDYLTGLPNRRTLAERGRSGYTNAKARACGYAVAVIDIDHFKSINDRFGHEVGDQALRHVALQLIHNCRSGETPTRQGGEEFVVLLGDIDEPGAVAAGERIRSGVEAAVYENEGIRLPITVSIGIAISGDDDASFDDLLSRADMALYEAKAGGRNRVALAAPNPQASNTPTPCIEPAPAV
ncbi:GGDEF domain-containing protein [Azonexus sp. IMCC34839]|uniref:GGDEF domain-containing protein n=1 Tax=Azonexus sp. IMCC34839 TaxID=3133695 RepID=UPI00399BF297